MQSISLSLPKNSLLILLSASLIWATSLVATRPGHLRWLGGARIAATTATIPAPAPRAPPSSAEEARHLPYRRRRRWQAWSYSAWGSPMAPLLRRVRVWGTYRHTTILPHQPPLRLIPTPPYRITSAIRVTSPTSTCPMTRPMAPAPPIDAERGKKACFSYFLKY